MTSVTLRPATPVDIPQLDAWDRQPHVISSTTDDPNATTAFDGIDWTEEIQMAADLGPDVWQVLIAELGGRPLGVLQIIDPAREPTHYWGDIEPGLRALDIWIGEPEHLGKGHGTKMMSIAIDRCFDEPSVSAIVIDPLASNTRAHRFYQRLGFQVVGPRRFNDEDDCLVHRLERDAWRVSSRA